MKKILLSVVVAASFATAGNVGIYGACGSANLSIDTTNVALDSALVDNLPDDKAKLILGGLRYTDGDMFTEFEYQKETSDFVTKKTKLFTVNYMPYNKENFMIFVGAAIGGQSAEWTTIPLTDNDSAKQDLEDDRYVYGVQIGAEYTVVESLSVFAKYQYLTGADLVTTINQKEYVESNQNNFIVGVSYVF